MRRVAVELSEFSQVAALDLNGGDRGGQQREYPLAVRSTIFVGGGKAVPRMVPVTSSTERHVACDWSHQELAQSK